MKAKNQFRAFMICSLLIFETYIFQCVSSNKIKDNEKPGTYELKQEELLRSGQGIDGYEALKTLIKGKSNVQSVFSGILELPPEYDEEAAVSYAYEHDPNTDKVNLVNDTIRDIHGEPHVFSAVKKAEMQWAAACSDGSIKMDEDPLGDIEFREASVALLMEPWTLETGDRQPPNERFAHIATAQTLGAGHAFRVACEFIKTKLAKGNPGIRVFLSEQSKDKYKNIMKATGLAPNNDISQINTFPYINKKTMNSLDIDGLIECLQTKLNPGDVVLLHAVAHNPTGVDPTPAEWERIIDAIKVNRIIPMLDCAYQGFGGGLVKDSAVVRRFADAGVEFMTMQSYSKNLGLYSERVGCLSIFTSSKEIRQACDTQLRSIIRPMYSNPPKHGCYIAKSVLNNPGMFTSWKRELEQMRNGIVEKRILLRHTLEEMNVPSPTENKDWSHVTSQIGMFAFTGLTKEEVDRVRDNSVYLLANGRISMAGITTANVKYVAASIKKALP